MRKKTKRYLKKLEWSIYLKESHIVQAKAKLSNLYLDLSRLKEEQLEILKKEVK